MRIAVVREVDPTESRVAATAETVKKMKGLGADVCVEAVSGRANEHDELVDPSFVPLSPEGNGGEAQPGGVVRYSGEIELGQRHPQKRRQIQHLVAAQ